MQNDTRVIERLFQAIGRLKDDRVIAGKKTFCDHAGINRRNLWHLEQDPSRGIMQVGWLTILVTDFKVSPLWLLTGEGKFYRDGWTAEMVAQQAKVCKKSANAKA